VSTPTTPAPYSQGDGSFLQWSNCLLADATMAMHRASVGLWRVAAPVLRKLSGDTSGGVSLDQQAAVVELVTKGQVVFEVRYGITRSMFKAFIASGRAASVIVLGSIYVRTLRRTNYFLGRHGLYVNAYRESKGGTDCHCELRESGAASHNLAHGEFYVKDPGITSIGFRWWSAQLLYRAAEMGAAAGAGAIDVSLTRDTEGVSRVARLRAPIRASASNTAKVLGYTAVNVARTVVNTLNGTPWKRDSDGGQSDNWNRIKVGTGYGCVRGEALR
jgi:hypothetical protein